MVMLTRAPITRLGLLSALTQFLVSKRLCGAMLILSLVAAAPAPAAVITVKTDRNPAVLQESFQLIFEANGRVDDDPDFTPLEEDFQILSTSVSSSMNIINSKITNIKQWQLTVLAKRAGALIVPAIAFGKDRSLPSSLMVKKTAANANSPEQQDVFVEVEAAPATAYVQSEIIYTVRLFRSLPMSNETLSDPELNQGKAVIEPLEDDKSYETILKGRRFGVFERRYAVYPQVSGTLAFAPVRYQGQAAGGLFGYDPFGPKPRTLIRQSRPVQLEIKPAPSSYQARHWLPAKSVKIAEEWSRDPFALSSGEPATRTVTVTAEGLTASQLPALPEQRFADFRQYPDQPTLADQKTGAGITGERRQKSAIIPMRGGEYVLPEIVLPWWNTETMTMEQAVLPARKVKVAASAPEAGASLPGLLAPAPMPDAADATSAVNGGAAGIAGTTVPVIANDNAVADAGARQPVGRIWQWLTLALAVAWLATILYLLRERRQRRPAAGPKPLKTDQAMKALKKACLANDSQQAKAALLQWARSQAGPSVSSLGDVEKRSGEKLASAIRDLSRRLYAHDAGPWQGEPLWQAFIHETNASKTASQAAPPGNLEPLFRL